MIYRKLFEWIDGDDCCEATDITLFSVHDTDHDEEQDFIIRRFKSLLETGATIESIVLYLCPQDDRPRYYQQLPDNCIHDVYSFEAFLHAIYPEESIETMTIRVKIDNTK